MPSQVAQSKVHWMSEMRYVLAAAYDDVDDALAAYEQIDVAYKHVVGTSLDFDAAVVAKDETGGVKIVERHDVQTRHGTTVTNEQLAEKLRAVTR